MLLNRFPDKENFLNAARKSNVIPVCAEILADMETPASLLSKFYDSKGAGFLLESVEGGERWGRYSFLGVGARTHIRVFRQNVEVEQNGSTESIPHNNDPLAVLREFMAKFSPANVEGLPGFWGGLVGYLTYEMVSFFEKIPNLLPEDKPIAHFILPDRLIIFDNIQHTLMAVVTSFLDDYDTPENAFDSAQDRLNEMLDTMDTSLSEIENETELEAGIEAGLEVNLDLAAEWKDKERYRDLVRTVKEYIVAGDVIQAVISQPFVCDAPKDLRLLYRAQRYVNPSPYMFFLNLGDTALIGSSPEVMVRLEDGVATVRPIAGTRKRGINEQEDRSLANELLSDEKERAEHLMLVDLGRNDLGRTAVTGTVQVTDLMIVERYSHVMHLVSNITCDVKPNLDAWDLIKATFPAGTLSGAPKVRAMEIISELENTPRGPYGGAVGYISFNGNMDLAITIRTACCEDDKLTVRAGAGIVYDSDPEMERVETINKAMAIQRALELVKSSIHESKTTGNNKGDSGKS